MNSQGITPYGMKANLRIISVWGSAVSNAYDSAKYVLNQSP
jgi:hypothetical protein